MYTFHHPSKIGAARATCTPTRLVGAAVFETVRSTFHARPHAWSRRPVKRSGTAHQQVRGKAPSGASQLHRRGPEGPAGFKPAVSACSNHAAKIGAGGGSCTHMGLRPPAPRAGASAIPPRPHKMDPARRVALRSSQYHWDTSLPTLCRNEIGRGGRTCTSVARWAARLQRAAIAVARSAARVAGTRTTHPLAALGAAPSPRCALRLPRQNGGARWLCTTRPLTSLFSDAWFTAR